MEREFDYPSNLKGICKWVPKTFPKTEIPKKELKTENVDKQEIETDQNLTNKKNGILLNQKSQKKHEHNIEKSLDNSKNKMIDERVELNIKE